MTNIHARALGRRRSPAKTAAAKQNAKLGGRRIQFQNAEEFWARVRRDEGCWTLPSRGLPGAYRNISLPGRVVAAHRYAYETAIGPIPPGLLVLHQCDNPPCVRPDHLRVGTYAENVQDWQARGRSEHTNQTYLLRNVPDELWARVKARAVIDGFAYPRYVILELLRSYVRHGLPKPRKSR